MRKHEIIEIAPLRVRLTNLFVLVTAPVPHRVFSPPYKFRDFVLSKSQQTNMCHPSIQQIQPSQRRACSTATFHVSSHIAACSNTAELPAPSRFVRKSSRGLAESADSKLAASQRAVFGRTLTVSEHAEWGARGTGDDWSIVFDLL